MTYQFRHVTSPMIHTIATGIDNVLLDMLQHLGQRQQAISQLLSDGKVQGADVDTYRQQVLGDSWDFMYRHISGMRDEVHGLLIGGKGRGTQSPPLEIDFWHTAPAAVQSDPNNPDPAPGLQGYGYDAWREAVKAAAIREIQNTWLYRLNDWEANLAAGVGQLVAGWFSTVPLIGDIVNTLVFGGSLPSLPIVGDIVSAFENTIAQANNELRALDQAMNQGAQWYAMMDGEGSVNPETWSVPVIGGLFDFDLFISGINRILDRAQQLLNSLDTQVDNGFQNIMSDHLVAWPQLGSNTNAPSMVGGGPAIAGAGGLPFGGGGSGGGYGGGSGGGNGGGGNGGGGNGGGDGGGGTGGGDGGGSGGGSGGGNGGGSGGGGLGQTFPPPVATAAWGDTQPDQFPQPQNLEDIARELIRRQGGQHHLLLITHFGRTDQNQWLVTIPDRGNTNFSQDPGDPGGYSDNFGGSSSASSSAGSTLGSAAPTALGTTGASGLSDQSAQPDSYLNNMASIHTELGGHLSPYGRFVAQAVQTYCTSSAPDPQSAGTPAPSSSTLASADLGGIVGRAAGRALNMAAPKLTSPPTSPQNPAEIWLIGQGLGGLVAQNLAAAKPFPGDNPGLGPAHVVKGVVAFGAPIIGLAAAGVSYDFFKIRGDRVGDVSLDSVGVNDARTAQMHEIPNPFVAPPWQSTNANAANYVKDPNDPQLIHNAYADSDVLQKTKLPFDITGGGGVWGPTYVVTIPQTPDATAASGATGSSTLAQTGANPLSTGS